MDFGLIGAAGYVAPRHIQAIKDTGHNLSVALDLNDSVGILDKYFPMCEFFTNREAFDRHVLKYENLDYIVVCSPNYLHESHCKMGMRLDADVICEKPVTTTVSNLRQLQMVETQMNRRVYSILQLRLHPNLIELKQKIDPNRHYNVALQYITPRGPWYFRSWKGKLGQSGGIETNIGIHFFDMLIWLFGDVCSFEINRKTDYNSLGILHLDRADVAWHLSLDREELPDKSQQFYRCITIDGEEVRFDNVFSDLHTESYRQILCGNGFGLEEAVKSIDLVERIRNS